jgi:streptogramin lyase
MTTQTSLPKHYEPSAILNRTTETDTMQNPKTNRYNNTLRGLTASGSLLALAGLLAGCGGALSNTGGITGPGGGNPAIHFTGNVHGGQQPVKGALIQLYTVGTGGLQSASVPLITPGLVTSDPNGNFNITGMYSCTSATQVYLVATQGDPGNGTNTAISMAAALGDCATLLANAATTFIQVNELTTVAAAQALAPFAKDYADIGANGANNPGLLNAFANANALVSTSSGAAPGTLPAGATVPAAELNTLGNILAACVNTAGSGSTQCSQLFTATGATETFGAALAIARKPGNAAITGLYTLSSAIAPFQPTLTSGSAPKDFSVAINYNAGGTFSTPYAIALDAGGNAWVTNETGTTVTELSPNGTVLASPTATNLVGAQGIAIDKTGNVWVANTAGNSVIKYTLSGGNITATNAFTNGGIAAPAAIAIDSAGTAWVANFNGNSVTALDNNGGTISGSPFNGGATITVPTGIAVDVGSGSIFVTSGSGAIVKLSNLGAFQASLNDNALQGPVAVAVGGSNQVVATGFTTGSSVTGALGEYTTDGTANTASPVTQGVTSPAGIASDFVDFFVANSTTSGSLYRYLYMNGGPNSPLAGFGTLNTPVGVAVDASGSVWTANSGDNTVSKFVGIAVPVATPLAANVGP